jgi:hypothetical protein
MFMEMRGRSSPDGTVWESRSAEVKNVYINCSVATLAEYARAAQEPEMIDKIADLIAAMPAWAGTITGRAVLLCDIADFLAALFCATGVGAPEREVEL